jgi:hypothetical protein
MTLNLDNLVFPPKISKPLGREKFFQLQVGREEKSLGTYALNSVDSVPSFLIQFHSYSVLKENFQVRSVPIPYSKKILIPFRSYSVPQENF